MRMVMTLLLTIFSLSAMGQEGEWILIDARGEWTDAEGRRLAYVFSPVESHGDLARFWLQLESISLADLQQGGSGLTRITNYMEADCRARTLAELIDARRRGPADFVPPGSPAAKVLTAVCEAD